MPVVALRFASATVYLFFISGWLVLAAFFGPRKFRLPETVALSFVTSLSITSMLAALAQIAGGTLDIVLYAHLAVSVLAGVVAVWRWPAGGGDADVGAPETDAAGADADTASRRWTYASAAIVAVAAFLSWVEGLWLRMSDLFYHIAGVASLLTSNQPMVTDPMFGLRGLPVDPTSGTFHTFLALAARLGGTGAFEAFEWLEPIVVGVYLLAFYTLARRLLDSEAQAFAALALFAAVVWSLDFRVVIYPKWLDPAIYWMGLLFVVMLLERFDWRALLFACVFAATTALVHLATAELWVLSMLALLAWSAVLARKVKDGRGALRRCAIVAVSSVAVLAPIVYRRSMSVLAGAKTSVFNPPAGSPMSDLPYTRIVDGLGIVRGGLWHQGGDLMLAFTVVAMLALAIVLAKRGGDPRTVVLVAAASIMPALMLNLVATKTLVIKYWFHLRRMSYVLRFVPALLLPAVWSQTRAEVRSRRKRPATGTRGAGALGVAAIVLGIAAFSYVEVAGIYNRFIRAESLDNFARSRYNAVRSLAGVTGYLASHTSPADTVAATEKTSYYLTALVPVRVIAVRRSHMPLAVEVRDGPERRAAQEQIFAAGVTPARTAWLLEAYGVGYVVASSEDPLAKFEATPGIERAYSDGKFVVYRFLRRRGI